MPSSGIKLATFLLVEQCFNRVRFEVFTAVTMKNFVLLDVTPCGSCDVSEEVSASIIRMTIIGELGRTLAVTSNRRTLRRGLVSMLQKSAT
jgi:hypothetical protein